MSMPFVVPQMPEICSHNIGGINLYLFTVADVFSVYGGGAWSVWSCFQGLREPFLHTLGIPWEYFPSLPSNRDISYAVSGFCFCKQETPAFPVRDMP